MNTNTTLESWNDLPHIDQATPRLSDDQELFAQLRDVLSRHDALNRFGITLLHKHFDLNEDEVLVEICDSKERTLTMRPVKQCQVRRDQVIETSWRLAENDFCLAKCKVVCFRDEDGFHEEKHWP